MPSDLTPARHSLKLGALAAAFLVQAAAGQSFPLTGIVRDFRASDELGGHPDFEVVPLHGGGLYAGNVWLMLGHDDKPMFTGTGRRITSQARDADGNYIAPHLANRDYLADPDSNGLPQCDAVLLQDTQGNDAVEISFQSVRYNDDGTSTWTYRVRELSSMDMSHWSLALDPSQSVVADGTTPGYSVGLDGTTGFYGIKWDVADTFSVQEFSIVLDKWYLGDCNTAGVLMKSGKTADTDAVIAPSAGVSPDGYPFDTAALLGSDPSGDSAANWGAADDGAITGASTFDQWYRDILGVNLSTAVTINLVWDESIERFVFDSSTDPEYAPLGGFFPINGELYGNYADTGKNFHFTYEIDATFVYHEGAGQTISLTGDDDIWVYIDHQLVIDLGGTHGPLNQQINLDDLDHLVDGEHYSFDLFFAERKTSGSNLRMEVSFPLQGIMNPTVSALFD